MPSLPRAMYRALLAAMLFPACAQATEWSLEPGITAGLEYHDNITFTRAEHESVTNRTISPRFELSAREPNWDVHAFVQARSNRYSDDKYDSNATVLRMLGRYGTERNLWQIAVSEVSDSVITGDQVDADTGLVRGEIQRTVRSVSPAWINSPTERMQLRLNYQATDASYENGLSAGYYDYEQRDANAQLSWHATERVKLSLVMADSRFSSPALRNETNTRFYQLGIRHQWTPATSWELSTGQRRTEAEGFRQTGCDVYELPAFGGDYVGFVPLSPSMPACPLSYPVDYGFPFNVIASPTVAHYDPFSETSTGRVTNANLTSAFERNLLVLGLSRTLNPSGSGTLTEVFAMQARVERPIIEQRLTTSLALEFYRYRAIGGNPELIDRDYIRVEPRIRWELLRGWTLDSFFRFNRQEFVADPDVTTSRSFFVTMAYRWPMISLGY